jgi:hypothetical protein
MSTQSPLLDGISTNMKDWLDRLSNKMLLEPDGSDKVVVGMLPTAKDILLEGKNVSRRIAVVLSLVFVPKAHRWVVWEFDVRLPRSLGEHYPQPFSAKRFLAHFGCIQGLDPYGHENTAKGWKSVPRGLWQISCANDIQALLVRYDQIAMFYCKQEPIFLFD